MAITPDGEIAVNTRLLTITIPYQTAATGVLYLCISHLTEYRMTGEEVVLHGHTQPTVATLEIDSCQFELLTESELDSSKLQLAMIYYHNHGDIPESVVATVSIADDTVIYPNDTDITWGGVDIINITGNGHFPYFKHVRVGNEYMTWTSGTSWIRGSYKSIPRTYHEESIHSMQWSPILDMRQMNALRFNIEMQMEDNFNDGVIKIGETYKHLEATLKKAAPAEPALNTAANEIIWLNSHLAAGYLTADMVAAYEEIQGIQESINNALSLINQLRADYSEATGDTDEQTRLENEIKKQQMSLLDYRTRAANLKAILATQTMDTLRNIDMRSFAYAIYITEATHTDDMDEPIMYEAEVDYSIVDAPSANTTLSTVRWHYSRRRNIDDIDWRTMERTYEATEPRSMEYVGYNVIYIPIRFGERIRYRVRAIGESGRVSEYTNYISYSFTGYSASQQYIMVSNIYNVLYPDPYQEGIITQELVNLLYAVIDEFRDKSNRITAIESQIQTLISEV